MTAGCNFARLLRERKAYIPLVATLLAKVDDACSLGAIELTRASWWLAEKARGLKLRHQQLLHNAEPAGSESLRCG